MTGVKDPLRANSRPGLSARRWAVMTAGTSKSILRMDGGGWGMIIKEILRPRRGLSPRKDTGVNNDKMGGALRLISDE